MSDRDFVEKKVEELLEPILKNLGLKLYDVEWLSSGRHNYLRIFIDKPGGVTIADCQRVSEEIGDILDVEDFIHVSYYLEVSSPGLNRELKKPRHFVKSIGDRVQLTLKNSVEGVSIVKGTIIDADEDGVFIDSDGDRNWFAYDEIAKAKVVFEEE